MDTLKLKLKNSNMITLTCDKIVRIIKGKKKLEEKLNVKITIQGRNVSLEGKPEDEYLAGQVIEALDMGFPFSHALEIVTEDHMFEMINIKDHTKRRDLERIRGRIIGTQGKTLQTLSELTECHLELKGNKVGLIGPPENIKIATEAIVSIIHGSKQANIYSFLERNRPEPIIDLGLKKKE
jgi:ribosomal RNA assembly protein